MPVASCGFHPAHDVVEIQQEPGGRHSVVFGTRRYLRRGPGSRATPCSRSRCPSRWLGQSRRIVLRCDHRASIRDRRIATGRDAASSGLAGRFPTPESLACLAGVAPSTRESGKARIVAFRWAVDKQLRDAVCDFAGDSRHANPWAADLYAQARARGHDHPHPVRILARAWLTVIWKCWTTNTAYDPSRHRALQHLLNQDQLARA